MGENKERSKFYFIATYVGNEFEEETGNKVLVADDKQNIGYVFLFKDGTEFSNMHDEDIQDYKDLEEPVNTWSEYYEDPRNSEFYPWASQEEKDEYYSIMNEHYEGEMKFEENNKRISDRILVVLKKLKGEEWFSELMEYSEEAETHNPFKIVRKPQGQWQEENYELLGGVWVDQSTSYPCEDCYYGTVTVKIDEKRYLEMPFSC